MARHKSILLVDDDAPVRDAVGRALAEADYRVVAALNGSDALRQMQLHSIDIAVLGLGRNVEDDWDTAERLRETHPGLRLIIAGADSVGFAHPLASTAEALIEKPIDISLLLDTLRELCATPSALSENRNLRSLLLPLEAAQPARQAD